MMNLSEYNQYLSALERANGDFHMMPTLRQGYSALNAIYMQATVDELFRAPTPRKRSQLSKALQPTYAKKRKLHGLRSKLSNKLVRATSRAERIAISGQILSKEAEIGQLERLIRVTYQEGKFVEPKDLERIDKYMDLPDDQSGLEAKRRSTMVMISQTRKKMKTDDSDSLVIKLRDLLERKKEIDGRLEDY